MDWNTDRNTALDMEISEYGSIDLVKSRHTEISKSVFQAISMEVNIEIHIGIKTSINIEINTARNTAVSQ